MTLTAGVWPGVAIGEYIRDPVGAAPSLSASVAHVLLTKSPRHARTVHPRLNPEWRATHSEDMDVGTIAHAILLEPDRSKIVVVDAADWRKKENADIRKTAWAEGKCPILARKMPEVEAMVAEAKRAIAESEIAAVFESDGGTSEVTLVWPETIAGEQSEDERRDGAAPGEPPFAVWCRTRPDRVSTDWRVLVDYKSTRASAEPNAFARGNLIAMGYDLQATFGIRGVKAVTKLQSFDATFVFVVQEVQPPYAVSFVALGPAFIAWAERKRATAVDMWAACMRSGEWPGYPARIAYAEPPTWAEYQWSERYGVPESAEPESVDDGRPLADQLISGGRR